MSDELLISLVEAHPELYDKRNIHYKFLGKKRMVWEQIGQEMNTTGEACMRRWTTLRDRYGREIRKDAAPSGSQAYHRKEWHLMESLQFLRNHVVARPVRCSINICPEARGVSQTLPVMSPPTQEPAPSPVSLFPPTTVLSPVPSPAPPLSPSPLTLPSPPLAPTTQTFAEINQPDPSAEADLVSSPASSSQKNTQRSSSKKKATVPDVAQSMCEAIELFKKKCLAEESDCGNPAVESFGRMMVSVIAKMPPTKQNRAMQRIMEVAFEVQSEPE